MNLEILEKVGFPPKQLNKRYFYMFNVYQYLFSSVYELN